MGAWLAGMVHGVVVQITIEAGLPNDGRPKAAARLDQLDGLVHALQGDLRQALGPDRHGADVDHLVQRRRDQTG